MNESIHPRRHPSPPLSPPPHFPSSPPSFPSLPLPPSRSRFRSLALFLDVSFFLSVFIFLSFFNYFFLAFFLSVSLQLSVSPFFLSFPLSLTRSVMLKPCQAISDSNPYLRSPRREIEKESVFLVRLTSRTNEIVLAGEFRKTT